MLKNRQVANRRRLRMWLYVDCTLADPTRRIFLCETKSQDVRMIDDFLALYRTTRVGNWQAFLNFHNIYASPWIDEAKLSFGLSIIKDSAARHWMDGRIDDRASMEETNSPLTCHNQGICRAAMAMGIHSQYH